MSGAAEPPNHSKPPEQVLDDALDKGYVGLHVEQGVPVLDRDLNLLGDLLRASLRSLAARYIGDGVAAGSQAFAIASLDEKGEDGNADNDFEILAGAEPPGRCLVGGIEASIGRSLRYREQGEGDDRPPELSPPTEDAPDPRVDLVYLDVWLTEEVGAHDPALANPDDIGLRTSTRTQVRWRVRVVEGGEPPEPAPRHVHFWLARLRRPRGEPRIEPAHITDLRRSHLNLANLEDRVSVLERLPERLVPDLFDVASAEYEEGEGRPPVSVREALNCLLRGDLLGSPPRPVGSPDSWDLGGDVAVPSGGTPTLAWFRMVGEGSSDARLAWAIMATQLDGDSADDEPREITRGEGHLASPFSHVRVVALGPELVLLAYVRIDFSEDISGGDRQVDFRLSAFGDLADADEHTVDLLTGKDITQLLVIATGDLVTFIAEVDAKVVYLRLRWTEEPGDWWVDRRLQELGGSAGEGALSAVADGDGNIWVAFDAERAEDETLEDATAAEHAFEGTLGGVPGSAIRRAAAGVPESSVEEVLGETAEDDETTLRQLELVRMDPARGRTDQDSTRYFASAPHLHSPATGHPWLLYNDQFSQQMGVAYFDGDQWSREGMHPGVGARDGELAVVDDPLGGLWTFWTQDRLGDDSRSDVWAAWRDPDTGYWSQPRRASPPTGSGSRPLACSAGSTSVTLLHQHIPIIGPFAPIAIFRRDIVTAF